MHTGLTKNLLQHLHNARTICLTFYTERNANISIFHYKMFKHRQSIKTELTQLAIKSKLGIQYKLPKILPLVTNTFTTAQHFFFKFWIQTILMREI